MPSSRKLLAAAVLLSLVAGLSPAFARAVIIIDPNAVAHHSGKTHATAKRVVHRVARRASPSLSNLRVSAATKVSVALKWNDSGSKTGASYAVYLDGVAAGTTTTLSYTVGKLGCGTSHLFSVGKRPSASPQLAIVSTTASCATSAPAPDVQPPTAPGSLVVSQTTASSITLTWAPSIDDVGVASYSVYLDGTPATTLAGSQYTLSGLACGSTHQVDVDAVDAAGNRSAKASVSVSTSGCPDTLPPLQPVLYATGADAHTATITWSVPLDNVGVTGYSVYLGNASVGSTATPGFTFTGLACGTTYSAGVQAYDAAGNASPRSTMPITTAPCADSTPPSQPASLHATSAVATSISIAWTASTDNTGVAGYHVYTNNTATGDTANLTAVQSGLVCGTTYSISVAAYDTAGNLSPRATISASTASCASADTAPPTAPTGLSVSGVSQTGLTLNWTASTDNVGVKAYNVFVNGTAVGQTAGTTYAFGGRACGTSYALGVEATDAAGNTSARSAITASTSGCAIVAAGASAYIAPNGSDAAPCTQAQPCASFQRGLTAAQPGQTVSVAAGSYPGQNLTGDRGGVVTFQASAAVTFAGRLTLINAHNVVLAGPIDFSGADQYFDLFVDSCSSNVAFNNVSGTHFGITGGSHDISFKGGSWGNITAPDEEDSQIGGGVNRGCGPSTVKNITLDQMTFHDDHWNQTQSQWGSAHPDCLQVTGDLDGLTITNSTFQRCANTFFGFYPDFGDILNVTFDHDTMTDVSNNTWWSAQLNGSGKPGVCGNFRFTNNTFNPNNPSAQTPYATLLLACPVKSGYAGALVQGNTFQMGPDAYGCSNGYTQYGDVWRSNVFTVGNPCVIG